MPQMTFVFPDGSRRAVAAQDGDSILDIARTADIDIEGACGGSMACATCHVIVEETDFDRLDPASDEEEDMLDLAESLASTSRLGCQIRVSEALDGLTVHVPATSMLGG